MIDDQPDYAPALHFRARLEWDAGDLDAAARDLASALDAAPGYADARVDASRLALERQQPLAAIALAKAGVDREPAHLGLLCAAGTRGSAWVTASLRPSPSLDAAALDGETHYNHGVALQIAGDAEAARAYQRALAFDPDLVAADFNLGVLFQQQGAPTRRSPRTGNVLARDPGARRRVQEPGRDAARRGRIDDWRGQFPPLRGELPDALPLAVQALEVLPAHRGDFAAARALPRRLAARAVPRGDETELVDCLEELLYLLLFFDVEPRSHAASRRRTTRPRARVYGAPLPRPAARRPGRLRIGYLSADLRNHVMGKMMWQAIAHHDRDALRALFYSLSTQRDEWTERFAEVADRFAACRASTSARRRAHRRRRPRHPRRPVDAHEGRAAGHPRAEAGARADHARRERRHASACRRSTSSSPTATPTCRRARTIRSSRCCRWTAASIRTGTSRRRRAHPFHRERARASPPTRS